MKSKIFSMLLATTLAVSVITGCGNSATETSSNSTADNSTSNEQVANTTENADKAESTSTDSNQALPANYEEFIASLHAGQSYVYAPICEGKNALLVTSYTFDDLEGHQASIESTIYIESNYSIEKVTTVQSGGTAYPIAVTDDNSLIISKRNSVFKGYVSKETGKFVITEESNINYSEAEDSNYHNYKDGVTEMSADSSLYDELSDKYFNSEILNFQKAGASSDGSPHLAGAVYAAYSGDDLYNITGYYIFDSETTGSTETADGVSGVPFTYELNGDDITFHFGSADDTSEAKFGWDVVSYPTITFTEKNETITLYCLGNENPQTFDAARYYDNDNNLFMQVKSFDETSLTGDIYREEKIKAEYVDNADIGNIIYSVNGTQFTVVSFEEVNKELAYGTDEEFKWDVVGSSRFDSFLVKCSDDDFYYALEKGEYDQEYKVVTMMNEGNLRKLIEENVTFKIKEDCEITLQKFVKDGDFSNLEQEYLLGREFKGDAYPGWSADAEEYYMTTEMLVAIGAVDGELYYIHQIYVP